LIKLDLDFKIKHEFCLKGLTNVNSGVFAISSSGPAKQVILIIDKIEKCMKFIFSILKIEE
jgi:hypothetical protein